MDLPRGLLEMIDEYVADALDSTGTHKLRAKPRPISAPPPAPAVATAPPEPEDEDTMIPIVVELDPATQPEISPFAHEPTDAALFTQLSQQLSASESPFPSLPRERAPRSSMAPLPAIVEDDDEVTNVVGKPKS